MKRILALALVGAVLVLTGGCSADSGVSPAAKRSIMDVLDEDMLSIYENRGTELPVAVIYYFQGEGNSTESPLFGEEAVNAALDAIAQISVIRETDRYVTDSDSSYCFIAADGSVAGEVSFNHKNLEVGDMKYEVEGSEALLKIVFPTKSFSDLLSIEGPDPELAAFLDRCVTERPKLVRVERTGSEPYEVSDSEAIDAAIHGLHNVSLLSAWKGAEPTTSAFSATFVMPDESEFNLTIYDEHVYLYDFPEPLLTWTYWIDGADYIMEALEAAR